MPPGKLPSAAIPTPAVISRLRVICFCITYLSILVPGSTESHQLTTEPNAHGERPAALGRSAPPCCSAVRLASTCWHTLSVSRLKYYEGGTRAPKGIAQ